jgi:hypothetical protein
MPRTLARCLVALIGAAALAALLPGSAGATRPSTEAEIRGILQGVQRSPLLARIPGRPFVVTGITVSTASASPLYASGVVSPKRVAGRRRPPIELLLRQSPDGSWRLLDFGTNFCGDAEVPGAVLQDLFGTTCGGSGGGSVPGQGVTTLSTAVAGTTTATLIAVRNGTVRGVPRASVVLNVAVTTPTGSSVVAQQPIGRPGGFNWNLLNRPGAGGVIALDSVGRGPQFLTVAVRRSASSYGTASFTFASNVLLPAG